MNTREQKTDLIQPLLQDFKIDIHQPVLSDHSAQNDKKRNNDFNCSVAQLDEIIKKIDRCILILNELKNGEVLRLERTKDRKCDRYLTTIMVSIANLGLLTLFVFPIIFSDDIRVKLGGGVGLLVLGITNYVVYRLYKNRIDSRNIQSIAAFADNIDEKEKNDIFDLARELEINPYEHSLIAFIKLMEKKKIYLIYQKTSGPCKTAFMMGGDLVYGAKSSVRTFFNNQLFDKKVCGMVFEFAGFSEPSKKEKTERVKDALMNTLFFTQPFDHEKDDRVVQAVLSYMGLDESELNLQDNALLRLA